MDERTLQMAEALALDEVATGIRRAVSQLPKQPADFNGRCTDCGDQVPAARIAFGAITCIQCQTHREWKASTTK